MIFSESLKKNRDFQSLFKKGRSAAERQFVMYAKKNGTDRNRIGITVSKKVGNSVVRHRVKRLVLEGYRLQEGAFARGYDIVVVARPAAAACTFHETKDCMERLGNRLHIREAKAYSMPEGKV